MSAPLVALVLTATVATSSVTGWEAAYLKERSAALMWQRTAERREVILERMYGDLRDANAEREVMHHALATRPAPERIEEVPTWVAYAISGTGVAGLVLGLLLGLRVAR